MKYRNWHHGSLKPHVLGGKLNTARNAYNVCVLSMPLACRGRKSDKGTYVVNQRHYRQRNTASYEVLLLENVFSMDSTCLLTCYNPSPPFWSTGILLLTSREHSFAQIAVKLTSFTQEHARFYSTQNWAIWIVIHAMSVWDPANARDICVTHYITWYNRKDRRKWQRKRKKCQV